MFWQTDEQTDSCDLLMKYIAIIMMHVDQMLQ